MSFWTRLRDWWDELHYAPRRAVACKEAAGWRTRVLRTLIREVLPPGTPLYLHSTPSFLCPDGQVDPEQLYPLSLLAPELRLAIDVIALDGSPQWHRAAPFVTRVAWEHEQQRQGFRSELLAQRPHLRYLRIRPEQAVDAYSLRALLREELGEL